MEDGGGGAVVIRGGGADDSGNSGVGDGTTRTGVVIEAVSKSPLKVIEEGSG